jgi:predicted dehydrogenase
MHASLGVGLVGYGFAGQTFHAPLIAAAPGLTLTAVASSAPDRVAADWPGLPVEASPAALFARDDIALAVIATPNASHYPLASAALAAGKHVVVDKPFTVNLAEAVALRDQAAAAGLTLTVFHNRRWDGDFLTLRQLIAGGALGAVVYLESHFDRYRPLVRGRWREQAGPGSGLWYDLGPHLLDQALVLFGAPETICADLVAQRAGAVTDDYFHVQLRYGPLRVILHATMLAPAPGPRFSVHGARGSYVKLGLDTQEDQLKAGQRPPEAGWGADPLDGVLTLWSDDVSATRPLPTLPGDYPAFYTAMRDAIQGAGPNPVPPDQAITVMALLELARESAATGRTLTV